MNKRYEKVTNLRAFQPPEEGCILIIEKPSDIKCYNTKVLLGEVRKQIAPKIYLHELSPTATSFNICGTIPQTVVDLPMVYYMAYGDAMYVRRIILPSNPTSMIREITQIHNDHEKVRYNCDYGTELC